MKGSQKLSGDDSAVHSKEWQRARRPEHKAERRDAILAAAVSLLDERGVEGTTLTEIASRAGLSKANCYRYFESREAILLSVTLDEAEAWTASVVDRLTPLAGSRDLDAVAQVYAESSAERPRLCMLISALSSVLERNVSAEAIAEFKRAFHPLILGSADVLRAAIRELTARQIEAFLLFIGMFTAGTWPSANPSPAVEEVLEHEEFAHARIDFETTLFSQSRIVLYGLLAAPDEEPKG